MFFVTISLYVKNIFPGSYIFVYYLISDCCFQLKNYIRMCVASSLVLVARSHHIYDFGAFYVPDTDLLTTRSSSK